MKRLTREMKEALDAFIPEYDEAQKYVWTDRRDSQTDENQGVPVSSSGKSDPTGDVAISQDTNRQRLAQAAGKLEHAAREIDAAAALVKKVFSSPDDYYQPLESYRG